MSKSIILAFGMLAFTLSVAAQGVPMSTNATATIITPLTFVKNTDMAFGNIAVGAAGGTVVLSTAGARTATGDVSFQAAPASTAASFTLTGTNGATYTISIPASVTLTGAGSMTLDTFVTNPVSPGTLTGGTSNLLVGGTLHVSGSQATGAYSATFDVTVGYN